MKAHIKKLLLNIVNLPLILVSILPNSRNLLRKILLRGLEIVEVKENNYLSLLSRPKKSDNVVSIEAENDISSQTAIIMQGQIVTDNDFTLETVQIYKKLYPGAVVIVSSWNTENNDTLEKLRKEVNCVVVLSEYPEHSGLLNVNYQVVTTIAGIRAANELGRKFVFKTRTDYRFYKAGLLDYLYSLLITFPLDEKIMYQKYRIVAGGEIRNSMFRPFWIADQFNYGYVDDMYNYWNYTLKRIDLGKKDVNCAFTEKRMTWNERTVNGLAAEPDIVMNYLNRMENNVPKCTVKDYWEVIRNQFVILSRDELGYYWVKYAEKHDESTSNGSYYLKDSNTTCFCYNWNFSRWLSLYTGALKYKEEYEIFSNQNRY